MTTNQTLETHFELPEIAEVPPFSRRKFLGYLGATSAIMATAGASCKKFDIFNGIDLGSGDVGILNYAYLLEQLEAAFYEMVIGCPYGKMSRMEHVYLRDIRNHEVAHREFFKAALGNKAIPELVFNFTSVDFYDRYSVLETAKTFEDLGVSAYNGAGPYLNNESYITVAGKIVSVEARHAALIRELLDLNSFADSTVINDMGLDVSNGSATVIAAARPYILAKINFSQLPF